MYKRTILYLVGLTILAIGCWLIVALFFGFPGWGRQLLMTAGCWLAAVSLFWFARRLDHRAWLPGRTKLVGYLFLLMIPALLIAVSTLGQRVNFRQLTEVRASQVSRAIEAYYEDNGRYPQELHQLTPRYILSLPELAIIFGQDWCFDSSGAEYVLGYVTCDHWSDPRLYGRIYSSTGGEGAEVKQPCEEEIAAMIARAPQYYELRRD